MRRRALGHQRGGTGESVMHMQEDIRKQLFM
jgi:hypothetical protein